ncbi:N-acetylmuramoyl-L-alanine amidase [Nocardia arthritidis]|uniref:N-acetylmuramoyl-L-alanine amidase n=1 Tax=Nocardia arthritidis TaxID=228602 RepID=UPI001EEB23B9|nr:N-acetylmuramoyl-L-alanine amidase [Nocardia arthritidis]
MPYRKSKRSYVLPVVTTLAVAAPLATLTLSDSSDYRTTTDSGIAAVPAQLAEVVLSQAPDIVLPLRELTGLNLPDLHLSDLRMLPLPTSIPVPAGIPVPPGIELPTEIPLPRLNPPQAQANPSPAPAPNANSGQPGSISPQAGQSAPQAGQSAPQAGQSAPQAGQSVPQAGQPAQQAGQSAPQVGQAAPQVGQSAQQAGQSAPQVDQAAPQTGQPIPQTVQPAPRQPAKAPAVQYISDSTQLAPGTTPDTPALAPGAIPPDLLNKVGAQVKELTRDKPFSVVALTAPTLADTTALIRAKQSDGTWGPWFNTESVDTRRADRGPADRTTGTEPIYVGNTNAVQILVTRKQAAAQVPPAPQLPLTDPVVPPPPVPAPAAARGDDPAQLGAAALKAVLIDPGRGAIDAALSDVAGALPGGGPNVISRAQWGADESIRCENPTYDDHLGGITVHHTAGRNDYGKAESAAIVRAIYTYHAKTLGWCDIGYNALVDKYGQIFEGRYGGLDRPVQGAHAGGFNENTSGVALMGNHESEPPTDAALNAIGQFIGWRAKMAGLDPKANTTMYSEGTEFTSYAQGQAVQLPIVFAHRDVGNTSCPGDAAYALMDRIRDIAASVVAGAPAAAPKPVDPLPDSSGPAPSQPDQPAPRQRTGQPDLTALAALTAKLLGMVNDNLVARHWSERGGANGPLGAPQSEVLPAAQGQQYAKFVNGYVYTTPTGQVFEVAGAILDRFLQLGADAGVLGLPLSNAYPVPDGLRSDFQNGSLILNQVTGLVSTVWKTYNDTYQQEKGNNPTATPAPAK